MKLRLAQMILLPQLSEQLRLQAHGPPQRLVCLFICLVGWCFAELEISQSTMHLLDTHYTVKLHRRSLLLKEETGSH